jgi:hypothetical protein
LDVRDLEVGRGKREKEGMAVCSLNLFGFIQIYWYLQRDLSRIAKTNMCVGGQESTSGGGVLERGRDEDRQGGGGGGLGKGAGGKGIEARNAFEKSQKIHTTNKKYLKRLK